MAFLPLPRRMSLLPLDRSDCSARLGTIFEPSAGIVELRDGLSTHGTGEGHFPHPHGAAVGHLLGCSSYRHVHRTQRALLLLTCLLLLDQVRVERVCSHGFGMRISQHLLVD